MPLCVEVSRLTKRFGSLKAVDDVSFHVEQGEFFGMLGPNGAGKTTILRILLDLFKPDSGEARILGGPMDETKKNRIGYMPEERGLYQDLPLERVLVYLTTLKGFSTAEARARIEPLLERFDLAEHRRKKVKDLSKGMQQKAQIISAIAHQPEVLIIDEPFSGLDPVNTQLVKDLLSELHAAGATIIMSTHQMHQVEALCERIVLIDHGHVLLYGALDEIRQRFTGRAVMVRAPRGTPDLLPEVSHLTGVLAAERVNGGLRLTLAGGAAPGELLRRMALDGMPLESFEVLTPTLDEIFIKVVGDVETGRRL